MNDRARGGRRARNDYVPQTRPRAMRDQGQRKLTPNYPDPGETTIRLTTLSAPTIALRASETGSTGAQNVTVNKPTGTVEGDVMIAAVATISPGASLSPPAGWTEIESVGSALKMNVWYKVATDSEPSSYEFTSDTSEAKVAGITTWTGVDNTTPIDVENGQATASGTSHATPDVTTTDDQRMIVTHHGLDAATNTWTPPSGMTEAYDIGGGGSTSLEASYVAQAAAGATGAKTATSSATQPGAAHILALVPALAPLTLVTPSAARRIRLIRVELKQPTSDGKHFIEIYYGTAATAAAADGDAAGGVVDVVPVPDQSDAATRTWGRGDGPSGARDSVLSARFKVPPQTDHLALIEYTEER